MTDDPQGVVEGVKALLDGESPADIARMNEALQLQRGNVSRATLDSMGELGVVAFTLQGEQQGQGEFAAWVAPHVAADPLHADLIAHMRRDLLANSVLSGLLKGTPTISAPRDGDASV